MTTIERLQKLWAHAAWADAELLAAIQRLPSIPAAVLREYAHVIGAAEVWLARIDGRPSRVPVWPELSLAAVSELAAELRVGYESLLGRLTDGDLARDVIYTNSAGTPFTTRLDDILLHVALHGQYHRGKVNVLLRQAQLSPAPVDYIAFVRGAPAATTSASRAPEADASRPADRVLLRHTVATLAYRAAKPLRDAPPTFADFRAGPTTRTPLDIVAHMADLFDWALALAQGEHRWAEHPRQSWIDEVSRFFAALATFDLYLASDAPLGRSVEMLFQGPIADALTHTGQLTMLRRLANAPIRGENYAKADIHAGRVGVEQALARVEFD